MEICDFRSIDSEQEESNRKLLSMSHKLMKSMKSMMAREKTLQITPKKPSKSNRTSSHFPENKAPNLQLISQ